MALIPLVADRSEEIAELCRKHQVQRLDLFGSAATGDFDPDSSDLTSLFDQPVDLVSETDLKNPYFRQAVEETRASIYVA
ncbi:MAG: nucleotidyltransferase domain-containing protein [Chloroflexota bacterium]|nr:nucleotidyltransferase domain-containing protein [Chloroflexota bacterium]MDE2893850.1 nucleotidyltransferase domain-containing protein [Chloroflexota bacterium]